MSCVDSDFSMLRDDSDDEVLDLSDDENMALPSKGVKSSVKSGANARAILSPNQNKGNVAANGGSGKNEKTIEDQYKKLSQREHVLVRPDTYIGSVESRTESMYVLNEATGRLVEREITFTPGLFKIFDEIVVNAADNKQRDQTMDKLDVTIDAASNTISVRNNGKGIPVVKHQKENCYVPTLIFGHLLTGSNFDDSEEKTTGGRNGYGAKLTNIFSTRIVVECLDSERGLKFTQVFENNMDVARDPIIVKAKAAEVKKGDYTMVTFSPDLPRFGMDKLDDDTVALLSKRAYDVAGSMASRPGKKLTVSLNEKKLAIKNFEDYLKLFDGINEPVAYEKIGDRWEVGVSSTDGSPAQISFVNAINTFKGGTHVNYIADQVAMHLVGTLKKKNKDGAPIKPTQIKNHLCIFVNCLVNNPTFDSQTKEFLTLQKKQFGSTCKLSEKFLKQVDKSDIVDSILSFARFKANKDLKRKGGTKTKKITGIPKLDDANFAGGPKSKDCTLIITEGDSAKSLAMSGLSVVGRDYYGVFPLKGKPLNVRDAKHAIVMKNEEMKNIIDILGLKMDVKYDETNIKTLRYGHLMIMADQDHDGSHIKGLVINMLHHFWPSLLDVPGFLQQFITPIVKVSKGKNSKTFFTLPQYEQWRESTGNNAKGWKIKYYKGLGTSTSAEAKEYFSNLDLHEISFAPLSTDIVQPEATDAIDDDAIVPDGLASGADLIDMVFRKDRAHDRRTWLNMLKKDTYLDYVEAKASDGVRYSDFINKELVLFSVSDNARSIPHVLDGFKPSQRKVLFSCFKRKLVDEIKVAQLAGYVSEHSAYHHGEQSLYGTIIGMAQSFVGSNNINLLTPSGQFGTRRMGGKDAASPRYVFTKLEKVTRAIFHPDDDELLNYLSDDGVSIEPEYYMPVIPMVLVNGSDGIGTGYSTFITNHCPRVIIANLRRMIRGEQLEEMKPHYDGFTGDVVETDDSGVKFTFYGKIERTNDTTMVVSELPIRKWTQDFKEMLEAKMLPDPKTKSEPEIRDFSENHTDSTVSFTITADKEKIDAWEMLPKGGLFSHFKLTNSLSNTNMTVFDPQSRIVRYDRPEDIMKEFYDHRMDFYVRRKNLLVQKLQKEQRMLANKARFVVEVCSGELVVSNRKKKELLADLQERGYELFEKTGKAQEKEEATEEVVEEDVSTASLTKGYEYLLGMKIWSLTFEKAEELHKQLEERTSELKELQSTSPSQIWLNDLDAVESALNEREGEMQKAEEDERSARTKSKKRQTTMAKKTAVAAKRKGQKKDEWDSDTEGDESDSQVEAIKKPAAPRRKPAAKPAAKEPIALKPATFKMDAVLPPSKKDDIEVSLAERMKALLSPSRTEAVDERNTKAGVASIRTALTLSDEDEEVSRGTKRPSPRTSDADDDDIADSLGTKTKPAPKRSKAVATKKAAPKKAAPKKAPAAKGRKKKQPEPESESEDDFAFDSDVDEVQAPAPSQQRAGGRSTRAAAQKVVYALSSEDEASDSDFE